LQLQELGYYSGPINGEDTFVLESSLELFQDIHGLQKTDGYTLAALQAVQQKGRQLTQQAEEAQRVALATPPSRANTQPLPTAPITVPSIQQTVALPAIPAPAADVIVEPVVIDKRALRYPARAERRNIYENVSVEVTYDITVDGRVENARITDIDYTGRSSDAFREEALGVVNAQRFSPRTVNGQAVATQDWTKMVRFRVE